MIDFKKYPTAEKLCDFIQSYYIIATGKYYKNRNNLVGNTEHLNPKHFFLKNHPQGSIDLMFSIREGGAVLITAKDEEKQLTDIFVVAQQEGKFEFSFLDNSFIIGAIFHGESFKKFYNFPMYELTNNGLQISEELDMSYHELFNRLQNSVSDSEIIKMLDQFFIKQLSFIESFTKFDKLIKHIRTNKGLINIDDLSKLSNMSSRTLQRKTKEVLGVSPKSYSQIIRFKYVMSLLNVNKKTDWQDILFDCGYYDQAHFIKDFKKYTGHTPSSFLKDDSSLSDFFSSQNG